MLFVWPCVYDAPSLENNARLIIYLFFGSSSTSHFVLEETARLVKLVFFGGKGSERCRNATRRHRVGNGGSEKEEVGEGERKWEQE